MGGGRTCKRCPAESMHGRAYCRECFNARRKDRGTDDTALLVDRLQETNQVHNLRKQNAALVKELHAAQATVRAWNTLQHEPKPSVAIRETSNAKREAVPVLMVSDVHCEETVDGAKVLGVNSYNEATALARLRYMFGEYIDRVLRARQRFTIHEGVVWLGGDLLSGYIHAELIEIANKSPLQAIAWLHEVLEQEVLRVLREAKLKRVIIPCNPGNHGRTTKDRRIATNPENNFEWLLYVMLQRTFAKHKRVQFVIEPAEFTIVDVLGLRLRTGHGENFRAGAGSFYAAMERFAAGWDKWARADITLFGHIHTCRTIPTVATNGSAIGAAPYGLSLRVNPEEAQQGYLLLTKSGIELSHPIRMGHIRL